VSGFATDARQQVPSGEDVGIVSSPETVRPARISRGMWLLGVTFVGGLAVTAALVVLSTRGSSTLSLKQASPPQIQQLLQGIPQHGNMLGSPSAPVKITEYADLQCPYCRDYELAFFPTLVRRYVRTGQAVMVLNLTTGLGRESVPAAEAAIAAGQQNRLWSFVDVFYNHQGIENSGYVTDHFLTRMGHLVPGLDVAKMMTTKSQPAVLDALQVDRQNAAAAKLAGTPTFVVQRAGRGTVKLTGSGKIESTVARVAK